MIQSVARASRILLSVARSTNGLTASEVATSFGLPLPTAYHLLTTLEHEQLLSKEPGKRYVLGAGAADIANAPGLRARVERRHRQALAQLADTTQETAYLTGWFRGEIRILATVEGSQAVRVVGLEVGQTGDVHARANAKVLLAFADHEQRSRILDSYEFTRFTPVTVRDRAALEAQMAEIRRTGIFYDRGEFQEDVRSVSAPIRRNGHVAAALAVTSPAGRYERTEPALVSALLSAVAFAEH
ncbi:IclR family transcriptional regulator [Glaciibacter sp. 2TAF33]|uniref:IclR family transcriptional regulator n=1 Tax=Glaciibacter sp. 2TAF33 TaxID=3233015 RepID=UPI003F917BBB